MASGDYLDPNCGSPCGCTGTTCTLVYSPLGSTVSVGSGVWTSTEGGIFICFSSCTPVFIVSDSYEHNQFETYGGAPSIWCNINFTGIGELISWTLEFDYNGTNVYSESGTVNLPVGGPGSGFVIHPANANWNTTPGIAAWNNSTTYLMNEVVVDGSGNIYRCLYSNVNEALSNATYWAQYTLSVNTGSYYFHYNGSQDTSTQFPTLVQKLTFSDTRSFAINFGYTRFGSTGACRDGSAGGGCSPCTATVNVGESYASCGGASKNSGAPSWSAGPVTFTNTFTASGAITAPVSCAPSFTVTNTGDATSPFITKGVGSVSNTSFSLSYTLQYNSVTILSIAGIISNPAFTPATLILRFPVTDDWTYLGSNQWEFNWYGLPSSSTTPSAIETIVASPNTSSTAVSGIGSFIEFFSA